MNPKDRQVLEKICQHIRSVLKYCTGCSSLDDFQQESMRVEACVFNLMQIGELAKTALSDEMKQQLAGIPWKQIYGLRNRIVHGYAGVNLRIVWDTIHDDLPALADELEKLL